MAINQIKSTKDYSIFKQVDFNRDKNRRHIEDLKKAISKENLLALHPIIVNEKMEVIDGQHRLEAAKELEMEIYYVQGDVSDEHILNSNSNQKKNTLDDVIKFYSMRDNNRAYHEFREMSRDLNIVPKALIGLLFGTCSRPILNFIKEGKFIMPDSTEVIDKLVNSYKNFMVYVHNKRITPFGMFKATSFTIAFRNMVLMPGFAESIFINKLDQRWFDIRPQANAKDWSKLLSSIYNYKNQNPLIFQHDE